MEEYKYIDFSEDEPFLTTQEGEIVWVADIFREYEERFRDAQIIAGEYGLEESQVREAISYWQTDQENYEQLGRIVEEVDRFEMKDASIQNESSLDDYTDISEEFEDGPLIRAENTLSQIVDRNSDLSRSNLFLAPDEENYLRDEGAEIHLVWEEKGSDIRLYAGASSTDEAYLSFSVDGSEEPALAVELEEIENRIEEVFTSARFGARH